MDTPKILVTAASGQLGGLVVNALLRTQPASSLAVTVRRPDATAAFEAKGIQAHVADYDDVDALAAAFAGVDRLVFISSSAIEGRVPQHRNVVAAAKRAGVGFVAYTSVLHADTSPLGLAEDHRQTERALTEGGLRAVFLRNGWYTENYAAFIPSAVAHGVLMGSAGDGRIASAARADYAEAAAAIITQPDLQAGTAYELAGDTNYTLTDLAAEIARASGKPVAYKDLPPAEFEAALKGFGLPAPLAGLLADSDAGAARGALDDTSRTLSRLLGRPTTPMPETVSAALSAAG